MGNLQNLQIYHHQISTGIWEICGFLKYLGFWGLRHLLPKPSSTLPECLHFANFFAYGGKLLKNDDSKFKLIILPKIKGFNGLFNDLTKKEKNLHFLIMNIKIQINSLHSSLKSYQNYILQI